MKKSVIAFGTAAVVLFGSNLVANPVSAERSLEDVKTERKEIKSELSKVETEVAGIISEINEINDEIGKLQAAINENKEQINKTKNEINALEQEISELQKEIDYLEDKIEERNEIIKNRISSYQESGSISLLDVYFGSKDFNDFISRVTAVITLTGSDQELIEIQEQEKQLVAEMQEEEEEKLLKKEDALAEQEEIAKVMAQQEEAAEAKKSTFKEKEKELQSKIDKLELKDSDLARIEASLTAPVVSLNTGSHANSAGSASEGNTSNNGGSSNNGGTKSVPYTGGGGSAIAAGSQFVGKTTYVFGAQNPGAGQFDCSGFVQWAYKQEGVNLPRNTDGMASVGTAISPSEMQPGDLVFFDTYKKNGHVGIYVGNGQFLGSQSSGGVSYASMSNSYWKGTFKGHVRRVK